MRDIGLVMGIAGTEVAKENDVEVGAHDGRRTMGGSWVTVPTDFTMGDGLVTALIFVSDFTSVASSEAIYDLPTSTSKPVYINIEQFVQFQLTVDVVALIIIFAFACILGSAPLTIVQLLWVNMIMDTLGALAMAT
ncbi:hypothetical protein ACLOJK_005636 [Asimina triloba]